MEETGDLVQMHQSSQEEGGGQTPDIKDGGGHRHGDMMSNSIIQMRGVGRRLGALTVIFVTVVETTAVTGADELLVR